MAQSDLDITIRPEAPADYPAIHTLTGIAFEPMPYGDGTEADSITVMRDAGDLILSLVAEHGGTVIGHIAFSPLYLGGAFAHWVGLGPISVSPEFQRSGVGRAMISEGLTQMRRAGKTGCALIGNPAVYSGSGFVSNGKASYRELPRELVQFVCFEGPEPDSELEFCPALELET